MAQKLNDELLMLALQYEGCIMLLSEETVIVTVPSEYAEW